jgi:hypothetical protein
MAGRKLRSISFRQPYVRQRPDGPALTCCNGDSGPTKEIHMYVGGILGTIIIIALIVWFVRRV